MFGYINIDKMELKVKEYYRYRAYYCGLCKALKKHYGEVSRLTLNYDMTFLVLLLTALYEPDTEESQQRCMLHPTKKMTILSNDIMAYAASVNVLLAYYKMLDDWQDDKSIVGLAGMGGLGLQYKKAKKAYPQLDQVISKELSCLSELEKGKSEDIDAVSNTFARIMSEIFSYKEDMWTPYLAKIGFSFGKLIYTLDAYDDLEEDKKKKRYNPLIYNDSISNDQLKEALLYELSIIHEELDKLPLFLDKGIIDNIFYSGVYKKMLHRLGVTHENLQDSEESGGHDEKSL